MLEGPAPPTFDEIPVGGEALGAVSPPPPPLAPPPPPELTGAAEEGGIVASVKVASICGPSISEVGA